MVSREEKIPFSNSSTPRASGLLQNRGSTRYFSTKAKKTKTSDLSTKSHTHWEACFKTNFFSLVNFGTPLSPKALCPLAEPLLPDSVGAVGIDEAGATTELTARFLEGEGGLVRRKAVKNKFKVTKNGQIALTCHYYQRIPPSASESLLNQRLVHPPPHHRLLTPSDRPTDLHKNQQ